MDPLKKLMEERNALIKSAQGIVTGHRDAGTTLTADERTELKSAQDRVQAIDVEVKGIREDADLVAAISGMQGVEPVEQEQAGRPSAKSGSLSDHVLGELSPQIKGRAGAGRFSFATDEFDAAKAAGAGTQVVGPWNAGDGLPYLTEWDRTIVKPKRDRLVVADLLGKGSISGTAISYLVEGAATGDYKTLAEGETKPQISFADPTSRVDAVKKIAGWTKFSDEFLEDVPFLKSEIDNRLMYMLGLFEERQLLNGDGTGNNLLGIRKRSGVQTLTSGSKAEDPDTIFKAMTQVQLVTDFSADGLMIHPLDYQEFRLNKDGNGQYMGGGYFQGQYGNGAVMSDPNLWGLRTVVTTAIERGKVLVANFNQSSTMYRKGGIRVEATNTNEDDFKNNLVMLRVEERIALAVRYPAAIVEVTLGA